MPLTRRQMLKFGLIGGAVALPAGKVLASLLDDPVTEAVIQSPPVRSFAVPLRIPRLLRPTSSTSAADLYEIVDRVAQVPILPGPLTRVWAYNGSVPGPTVVQEQGRDIVVRHTNRLPVPITVHLHGGDVPADSDGHPTDLVPPGASKDYFYPGLHPAANLWYHDHAEHVTGRNVWMGLAGVHLFVSAEERALGLPRGRFDVPLAITDRFFFPDNQILYPVHSADGEDGLPHRPLRQGAFGDVILVNGTPKPFFRVARRKYRFRIYNMSTARIYRLVLSTGDPFIAIQTEGGFMSSPVETREIVLSPSERISVIVDFSRHPIGRQVVLLNTFEGVPGDPYDEAKTREVMRFDVLTNATDPSRIPTQFPPMEDPPTPAEVVKTREWIFDRSGGEWTINSLPFDDNRIDAFPVLGTVERWRFINGSGGWVHPIHPHLVEFLIEDRDGAPPRPWERGPKDTVLLGENEVVNVLMRFNHFRGVYAFHCHNTEHEDRDMMTQFQTV